MTTQFDQDWLTGTGTYLDDVLWPAVVRSSEAAADSTEGQREAAWAAYCDYGWEQRDGERVQTDSELQALMDFIEAGQVANIDGADLFDLVDDHPALSGIVEAVNDAIESAADDDDDDDDDE